MNKKRAILLVLVIILVFIVMISINFFIPKKIMKVDEEIDKITIFNGKTGKLTTIIDKKEINSIAKEFNDVAFLKKGFALGRIGYSLNINYYDKSGKNTKKIIVNSEDTIRYRGFFYEPQNSNINFEYLNSLTSE